MEERFGPWHVGRRLATGGLAEVAVAHRDSEDREIALKRLHPHQARDAEVMALFAAEVALSRDIEPHPNLVHGIDAGDVGGRPWLAMPLIDGADLRRRIDAGERPTVASAIRWIVDAGRGAAHLHDRGWVHGDINPSNLLVDGSARVAVCDLGVARRVGAGGPVRGTHAYMAPEQVRGEAWTAACDVFALGVILWELIAGDRLFHRGPSYLTLAAVVEAEAPPLADAALDAVARRALAKAPAARIELAEMTAALTAIAATA